VPLHANWSAMPHLIRSACLTDFIEVARSVGLGAYRMVEAVGLPRTSSE
jgi:hypothetical protein